MTVELPDHFYMAPSSADRWIPCPGSLRACVGIPDDAGPEAERGTLGHHLTEVDLEGVAIEPKFQSQLDAMDPEERDFLMSQVETCVDAIADSDADVILYETKIQHDSIKVHGGTIDVMEYWRGCRTLQVTDFKFGEQYVEIEDNKQVKCYLNLGRQVFPEADRFIGRIIQPFHSNKPLAAVFSLEELEAHGLDVLFSSTSDRFQAGDHCEFCPFLPQCETAAKALREECSIFPDLTTLAAQEHRVDLETLCKIYKTYKLVEKAVKGCAELLKQRAREGGRIEEYGLGLSISYRQAWSDLAEDVLIAKGVNAKDYLKDPDLKTPKQLREALKLSKEEFDEQFEEALKLTPVVNLARGKAHQSFPEFD